MNNNQSESTTTSQQNHRTIRVYFKLHYVTYVGRAIYIVGDLKELGMWDPAKGVRMQWNDNHEWTCYLKLDRSLTRIQYKFLVNDYDNPSSRFVEWEPGENRVVTQHVLQMAEKKEYFNSEYWGYRTIKLKLNYNLPQKQRMMIVGSIPELGSWQSPVVMKCQNKIDIISNDPIQQWSISLIVNPTNFSFRYFYVIRNDEFGSMIWERGNGRSLKSTDLHSFRQVEEIYSESPIRVKTQLYSVCQLRETTRNGSFCQIKKQKSHKKITNQGYSFSEKGPSFFYYETFGRLNKLDWNFVVQFTTCEINENIIIGPYPQNEDDIIALKNMGVKAVLNLQTRLDMHHRGINWDSIKEGYKTYDIVMRNFEIFDMDPIDFEKKANKAVSILKSLINKHELVYVHCTAGIGRAPSVVVLYLSCVLMQELEESIQYVKQKRSQFYINYHMLRRSFQKTMMYNHGEGYDFMGQLQQQ